MFHPWDFRFESPRDSGAHSEVHEKRVPGCLGYLLGRNTTQLNGDYFINHDRRIPSLNNQDSMESTMFFFRGSIVFVEEIQDMLFFRTRTEFDDVRGYRTSNMTT